jgi:hypothetical protein
MLAISVYQRMFLRFLNLFDWLIDWLIDYDGMRLCLRTATTNGLIIHPAGDIW